jgi:L-glutamine-phosphate cytidylyltransferase
MRHLTDHRPKCLLEVAGRPLIDHTLDRLRRAGCMRVIVVTGYRRAELEAHLAHDPDVVCVYNPDAADVNVLHSLMSARSLMNGPMIVTYSDVYLSWPVFEALLAAPGDLVVGVDVDWRSAYAGRHAHPLDEAEKVYVDGVGAAVRFGKHLPDESGGRVVGEFVGALRSSALGTRVLLDRFAALDTTLGANDRFQASRSWRQAYLTDLLQECVDQLAIVTAATVRRGWMEFDTPEDYSRLSRLAAEQRLDLEAPHGSIA